MNGPVPALTVLSLFAGIGGLDLGLERAGLRVVGQVEIDPFCRSVLARHWPEVPRHDDVRTALAWWTSTPRPRVDVVAGGFPCQPFSTAGRRRGVADQRWGWPAMVDVVRLVRPRYVLVENVPGLLADRLAFGRILADLATLGFDARWGVLPACALGAPHTRERLFLLAHPHRVDGRPGLGPRERWPVQDLHREPHPWTDPIHGLLEADTAGRGMAHGIPTRLDRSRPGRRDRSRLDRHRIRALGNAVVPAVAEHLGHHLTAHAARHRAQRDDPTPIGCSPFDYRTEEVS
jgi:DNA (cytosine-5)-methyltransferase 1